MRVSEVKGSETDQDAAGIPGNIVSSSYFYSFSPSNVKRSTIKAVSEESIVSTFRRQEFVFFYLIFVQNLISLVLIIQKMSKVKVVQKNVYTRVSESKC